MKSVFSDGPARVGTDYSFYGYGTVGTVFSTVGTVGTVGTVWWVRYGWYNMQWVRCGWYGGYVVFGLRVKRKRPGLCTRARRPFSAARAREAQDL